jgi:haloacetate dehalogenase
MGESGTPDGFEAATVHTAEAGIFLRRGGCGPPVLLLHGFPQIHLMWPGVAPLLVRAFTVVCAGLRGCGRSGWPASAPDRAPYARRATARTMVIVVERLGFRASRSPGNDRGGRVAHRSVSSGRHRTHDFAAKSDWMRA